MAHIDIDLKQSQITCSKHRLPFNAPTTNKALVEFGRLALLQLADIPSFARGVEAHAIEENISTGKALGHLLDRASVCCRLRHQDLFVIYRVLALSLPAWEKELCDVCGGLEYGAAYNLSPGFGGVCADTDGDECERICIRCVAYGD
tara:strand:- start:340 stop:780 length:441 start_codon:yes stop_codon:yes gene_type:complete